MNIAILGEGLFAAGVINLCESHTLFTATTPDDITDEWAQADLVIEMCHTSPADKRRALEDISLKVMPDTLILTSALTRSATESAAWATQPERVVGFGLLPPITVDGMVELCAALQTTPDSMARAQSFWQSVGQTPHTVTDGVGLVRARIVCCVINEAFTAMHEGVATADDIDRAMRLGTNYPHGPFEWTELIGIETVLAVMEGLFAEWGEDRYRPAPLLRRMVAAGVTVSRAAP